MSPETGPGRSAPGCGLTLLAALVIVLVIALLEGAYLALAVLLEPPW